MGEGEGGKASGARQYIPQACRLKFHWTQCHITVMVLTVGSSLEYFFFHAPPLQPPPPPGFHAVTLFLLALVLAHHCAAVGILASLPALLELSPSPLSSATQPGLLFSL